MDRPHSTLEGITGGAKARSAVWARRAFLVVVLLFVVAGLCGFLGVKKETTSTSSSGYHLSLTYPRIARAGLDVPWQLTVTHPGGFTGPVRIEVTGGYFDILDSTNVSPEPADETRDGTWWHWTFDRPGGDTLVVQLDTYIQPSSQRGRSGTVRVLADGRPAASLSFSTSLLP